MGLVKAIGSKLFHLIKNMALGADIWTVVDGLVRVLMQSAVMALMSRLCTTRFSVLPARFPVC